MTASITSPGVKRSRLWFGLFGGAIAWLLHLIGASIVAEWGCVAGLYRWQFGGITAVAWMVIALSAITLLAAGAATWSAYRVHRHYREIARQPSGEQRSDEHGTDVYMATVGLWSSALFVFIILAESVPILFYLTEC